MQAEVLDDFEDLAGWMPVASGLAELRISPERGPAGAVMRLDFDFKGSGGFVVARKPITYASAAGPLAEVGRAGAPVRVFVVRTDEELQIARETPAPVRGAGAARLAPPG